MTSRKCTTKTRQWLRGYAAGAKGIKLFWTEGDFRAGYIAGNVARQIGVHLGATA